MGNQNTGSIIDKKKANTTIEFTIIRQRLLFSFERVLNLLFYYFFCVSIVYVVPYTVLLY